MTKKLELKYNFGKRISKIEWKYTKLDIGLTIINYLDRGGFVGDLGDFVKKDEKAALVIDPRDNVAVALMDLSRGDYCAVRREDQVVMVKVMEDIPFGHKLALTTIEKDESVYKYGEEIGKMKEFIEKGGWIHSHNMYCDRGMKHGR